MRKKGLKKRIFVSLLIAFMLFSSVNLPSFYIHADDQETLVHEKISDTLKEKLKDDADFYDCMIMFEKEADIKKAVMESKKIETGFSSRLNEKNAVIGEMKEVALRTQQDIITYLDEEKAKGNVKTYESFFIVNSMHLIAKANVIKALASLQEVKYIDYNEPIWNETPILIPTTEGNRLRNNANQLEWNIKALHADKAWAKGFTGKGVTVGIIDSAVDVTHPALKKKFKGYDVASNKYTYKNSFIDCTNENNDLGYNTKMDAMHGTHCMGIVLGDQEDSKGQKTNQIGIAPDAKFIAARVFDNNGGSSLVGFHRAAQFMLAPGGSTLDAPSVVNNSWGGGRNTEKWFEKDVEAWVKAGIFPVFASGNKSPGESDPGPGSIAIPANYKEAFAVGAVDSNFKLAYFSKRGPSPNGNYGVKPEVSAPGVSIRSSVKGGDYLYMSGTSMAAPHVTGVAALIKQAKPDITIAEMRDVLESTAVRTTDKEYPSAPNYGYGYGVVNAYAAISKVTGEGVGTVKGNIKIDDKNAEAEVYIKETDVCVTTNANSGEYSITHPVGNYTLICNKYGYDTVEIPVKIEKDKTLQQNIALKKKASGKITGYIKDKEGKGIENVFVRVLENSAIMPVETDNQGKYTIENLPYGKYTLRFFKSELITQEKEVSLDTNALAIEDITLNISEDAEYEISHHEGDNFNLSPEENYPIGYGSYEGCGVMFTPTHENSKLKKVEIQFANRNYHYSGTKAKLKVVQRDEEGRIKELIKPFTIEFTPGKRKVISLEEYALNVDKTFYVVLATEDRLSYPFLVGTTRKGEKEYSYHYYDGNLVPLENDFLHGALMIKAILSRPKDALEKNVVVAKPSLAKVTPNNRTIQGKAKAYQKIQIVLGSGSIFNTIADEEGNFKLQIDRQLIPGEKVTCYARNVDGVKSEGVFRVVSTDASKLQEAIQLAKGRMTDEPKYIELKAILDESEALLKEIQAYEKNQELDSEKIKKFQEQINQKKNAINAKIIELSEDKIGLLKKINEAETLMKEVWTSQNGANVPFTKKWAKSQDKQELLHTLLRAKGIHQRLDSSEHEINSAIKKLEDAVEFFNSKIKKGKKEIITDINSDRFKDGEYEGEGRGRHWLASHVIITIKEGKLADIKITDWNESQEALKALIDDGYINRLLGANALDVVYTKRYEKECVAIVNAIMQALEKAVKEGVELKPDLTLLKEKIESAKKLLKAYPTSTDGKKLSDGSLIKAETKWVENKAVLDLNKEIENANKALENKFITPDMRNKQITLLEIALRNFNQSIKTGPTEEDAPEATLKDGKYKVSAKGYNLLDENTFTIIIKKGVIDEIVIDKWADTDEKSLRVIKEVKTIFLDKFKGRADSDVEVVSGATESSKSVREAVDKALKQAKKPPLLEQSMDELIFEAKEKLYRKKIELPNKKIEDQEYIDKVNEIIKKNDKGHLTADEIAQLKADLKEVIENFN